MITYIVLIFGKGLCKNGMIEGYIGSLKTKKLGPAYLEVECLEMLKNERPDAEGGKFELGGGTYGGACSAYSGNFGTWRKVYPTTDTKFCLFEGRIL